MTELTPEQIEEFWECYGFYRGEDITGTEVWKYPDRKERVLLPPIDLNSLFRWAVPKLMNQDGYQLHLITELGEPEYFCCKVHLEHDPEWMECVADVEDNDPALALFWALWQVKEAT